MGSASKHILIIEDDQAIRETFAEILVMEGYQVAVACNGQEGLAELSQGPEPCLILLDLMMPVMDGFTFRQEQLKHLEWSKIPVIILSADGNIRQKLDLTGGITYIRKPPDLDVLIKAVKTYSTK